MVTPDPKPTHQPSLAMLVLALLEEHPMHVYGLHKLMLERGHNSLVNVERRNSVQQVLTRLARDGYVTAEPGETGRRIVFRNTDAGRELLFDWLRTEISRPHPEHPRFPVAVSLLGFLPPDEAGELLADRRDALAATVRRLCGELEAGSALPRVLVLEVELNVATARAELDWLERLVGQLEAGELDWDPARLMEASTAHLHRADGDSGTPAGPDEERIS